VQVYRDSVCGRWSELWQFWVVERLALWTIVLKYFPPIELTLRGGRVLRINHAGLVPPGESDLMSWATVADASYSDGAMGTADVLDITHYERGRLGAKSTKIRLPGIGSRKANLLAVFAHYLQRHRIAQQYATVQLEAKVSE
jgi:hypothetical protein